MLAVGRALMAKPKLVMMDEPSLGLAPLVVKGIFEIIKEINRQGITVLLLSLIHIWRSLTSLSTRAFLTGSTTS